jgi:hypothetical protein
VDEVVGRVVVALPVELDGAALVGRELVGVEADEAGGGGVPPDVVGAGPPPPELNYTRQTAIGA